MAQLAGRTALDRYSGRVVASWDTMDAEDQRSVLQSLIKSVDVGPALPGYGWHKDRLRINWRFAALASIEWPPLDQDVLN